MHVLVVNAGSSSLKLRVVGPDDEILAGTDLAAEGGQFDQRELAGWLDAVAGGESVEAVGHRVVHGGERYVTPTLLDAHVEAAIAELTVLAPLHQPAALAGIAGVRRARPHLRAVACFDTAFHATITEAARTYAVPEEWRRRWNLRRYGFHGLSHAWAARRVVELCAQSVPLPRRVVTCHLGAGASLAAVLDGRSVDTTMGFTPLEGLVMATRSGSVDPGLLLWLLDDKGLSRADVEDGLVHGGGLVALAGTGDMRAVLRRAHDGDDSARLGFDVYMRSLVAHVAAMVASVGGLDALVFTGGVGENAPEVRAEAASRLAWLGVAIDPERNRRTPDAEIGTDDAPVSVFTIAAREELEIARGVRSVLDAAEP